MINYNKNDVLKNIPRSWTELTDDERKDIGKQLRIDAKKSLWRISSDKVTWLKVKKKRKYEKSKAS